MNRTITKGERRHLALVTARDDLQRQEDAIKAALSGSHFCLHSPYGTRRWTRWGEESAAGSYAREVAFCRVQGTEHLAWGREWWLRRRGDFHALVAWTEDSRGRIVRGWVRHSPGVREAEVYDAPGRRGCPIEATHLGTAAAGCMSFPAAPFQMALDGNAEALAVCKRLLAIPRKQIRLEPPQASAAA
jgi:hypothetical protein